MGGDAARVPGFRTLSAGGHGGDRKDRGVCAEARIATLKKKNVAAELSHTLTDISDYKELWQVFQTTIAKLFPIDWLGIYSAPSQGEAFNVTSNPHLPFNWDEL
ncbi:hypothetical protein [Desulfosarcina cetonica]|uniref:hypothetical protein n=1 Tax=Desulfosarcina cetonica TaxID=90730 RepID=UPI0012EDF05E|nr:hypothetical protein [Desulfosarcina cetonica]